MSEDAANWSDVLEKIIGGSDNSSYFSPRFAIVHDAVLAFLADTATEIRTRIQINNETGTVKKGALWYEENLPAETLLYGILGIDHPHKKGSDMDTQGVFEQKMGSEALLQIGGKATVGRGLIRFLK